MRRGLASAALIVAVVLVAPSAAAVPSPQKISFDPFNDETGQHETAVEPDSFAVGGDVVAVFQVGRRMTGGASGIGFATSRDGGRTWTPGIIPFPMAALSLELVSDPTIAYDRVHGVWVASVLGGRVIPSDPPVITTNVLAATSSDGVSWTTSVVNPSGGDKNWIVCDNGTSSPHAGRCYVVWTGAVRGALALVISSSDDGGRTWSTPLGVEQARGLGMMPLVRPDGSLVVLAATGEGGGPRIEAVRSSDGGRTFGAPVRVAALRTRDIDGVRVPALHSAEIASDGTIVVAWQDCRFRARCAANDILYSSSRDGRTWTAPLRVPTGTRLAGLDHVTPGLAVDPTTSGARTRLGLVFYVLSPRSCAGAACRFEPFFVSSPDNGRSWSAPERLGAPAPAGWFPRAGGRFAGDYLSASFVGGGSVVPVYAWASAPFDGRFHQGVYTTVVPPLPARPAVRLGPPRIRVAARLEVRVAATPAAGGRVICRASSGRPLELLSARHSRGSAVCLWRRSRGSRVTGTITLVAPEGRAARRFAWP
jgi:hypothetical protein